MKRRWAVLLIYFLCGRLKGRRSQRVHPTGVAAPHALSGPPPRPVPSPPVVRGASVRGVSETGGQIPRGTEGLRPLLIPLSLERRLRVNLINFSIWRRIGCTNVGKPAHVTGLAGPCDGPVSN